MRHGVVDAIRSLRLKPFDTATPSGRARERNRRIAWTSVTAAAAKGTAAACMLLVVPLTLGYLGPERFGLWMAVAATAAMLTFADLGLGNGLMTAVAQANGSEDTAEIRRLTTNAFLMLSGVGAGALVTAILVHPTIPWARFFNVTSPLAVSEAGPLVLAVIGCFALNLPASATSKLQLGLQRGYLANLWEMLGSLLALAGILVGIRLGAGLVWLALALAGVPLVVRAMNTAVFLGLQSPGLRPSLNLVDPPTVGKLFRIGGLFFVLQLAVVIGFQSDNVVVARLIGPEAVAVYDVAFKLVMLPSILISFIVLAQWPAYAEAVERGDLAWVRTTFSRTLKRSLFMGLASAGVFVVFGRSIIRLWAGPEVVPDASLVWWMAVWSVLYVIGNSVAALLNGLQVVRFQAVSASVMAAANILLSIYLVGRLGIAGAIVGSVTAYTLLTLVPCLILARRLLVQARPSSSDLE